MFLFVPIGLDRLESLEVELGNVPDIQRILDEGAAILYNRTRTRFLQQVSPDGVPWQPSFAATKEHRKTLFKTGKLFRSIQLFSDGPNQRSIGTDVESEAGFPYAIPLQFGSSKMVARPFIGYNVSQDFPLLIQLVMKRINEGIA